MFRTRVFRQAACLSGPLGCDSMIAIALAVVTAMACRSAQASERVDFNREIRPILSEYCFVCHGPDAKTREADLRLDTRDGALADLGGYAALVPGKPDESQLLGRIVTDDPDERMPPAETEKELSPAQITTIRRWIEQDAPYRRHWSLEPIRRELPPAVKNESWPLGSIDRFILARLEKSGITPSPEADRYTLIRRVYLDLIGLPPSPEEVDVFVRDDSPAAYERVVDRLLSNPHFGERWGRYWLDQARYADSHGYTNDNERVMWPYRDWVIEAFNRDLPFDRFTIEQLAGDLLPDPSSDQLVATGFHRNTLINTEGGTKADQFRVEQVKDRVDTTGVVWMGLTVGCAKCHSHKYDPIEQAEYYELYAFFNSTADQNSVSPTIPIQTAQQKRELDDLQGEISRLKQRLEQPDSERDARRAAWERELAGMAGEPPQWVPLDTEATSRHGAIFEKLDDGSLLVSGANQPNDLYSVTAHAPIETVRAVRLEALTHPSLPKTGPGRAGNGNLVLSDVRLVGPDGKPKPFASASADHSQPSFDVAGAIDEDPKSGWAINQAPEGGVNHNRVAKFVLAASLRFEPGAKFELAMTFNNGASAYNLGRFRLSVSSVVPSGSDVADLARIAAIAPDKRTDDERKDLGQAFERADPQLAPLRTELKQLESRHEQLRKQVPSAMVMRELATPRATHVQVRGDFLRPSDRVEPDVPDALPPLPPSDRQRTRLDLARWITGADHPLTARVRVNRIWMRLFGRGFVETENDFGIQGSPPTHPELLDWLAGEFREQDWSTKKLLRLIVTSATYRQSSRARTDLAEIDPRNELLARQSRLRVEAEIVRDLALAASGLLSDKIGGPSVYPPQPDGVYAFTQVKKNWRTSQGEDRYRRGIYTFFYRSAPHPMLTTFDVPKFNQTCTRRDRSNTPLQSLTVANDAAMFEMARALAARVLREIPADQGDDARLTRAFRVCFARLPEDRELARLREYLEREQARYREDTKADAATAWTSVARVLMNLDEFITRE
jgi:mono/diheme cytochrome c family protein